MGAAFPLVVKKLRRGPAGPSMQTSEVAAVLSDTKPINAGRLSLCTRSARYAPATFHLPSDITINEFRKPRSLDQVSGSLCADASLKAAGLLGARCMISGMASPSARLQRAFIRRPSPTTTSEARMERVQLTRHTVLRDAK